MNIIIKTKKDREQLNVWLDALRNGNYRQTYGCLNNEDGFCCLGVACDLFIEDPELDDYGFIDRGLPSDQFDSPKWLKRMEDVSFDFDGEEKDIASLNDENGLSFDNLANLIELKIGEVDSERSLELKKLIKTQGEEYDEA